MVAEVRAGRCPIPEPGLAELVARGVAAGRLTASTDPAAARGARAVLITVGTPLSEDFTADLGHIRAACAGVAPHLHDGQIVMIKSTVPPGTTRAMYEEIIAPAAKVHMAFSPERLAEGAAIRELASIPILVGGIDAAAGEAAAAFWREALPVEVMTVASPEAAEMVKLADNLWIDLNIALANELAKLVDAMPWKIDVMEVIRGANSLKKGQHHVNILHPGERRRRLLPDQGPLVRRRPRPPRRHRAQDPPRLARGERLDARPCLRPGDGRARRARAGARRTPASRSSASPSRATPATAASRRSRPLVAKLRGVGCGLRICDPMVTAAEAAHHGIALEPDWRRAVAGADAVLILAGHDEFTAITAEDFAALAPGALIYDGRIYYPRGRIAELEARGPRLHGRRPLGLRDQRGTGVWRRVPRSSW